MADLASHQDPAAEPQPHTMQLDERPRDEKVEKDDDASSTQDDSEPAIEKAPDQILAGRNTFLGTMYSRLFRLGVESRGVERVLEEDRSPKNAINSILLWFSVNTVLTTIPIGALAQEVFFLTLPHAIAVIFTFTALGCATTAFIATLGPKTGCRTMVVTRFSFGYVGGVILSVFNILTQMGFSVICVVLGGQTLASINDTLPLPAGIVIIAVCSLVICFFGYDLLHHYERYAYIVITVIVIMLYVLGSQWPAGYDLTAQSASEATGTDLAADVLSFGAVMFGSSAGWAPVAADFNMRLPESTSSIRVFWLTFIGLYVPIVFVSILGACLVTIQNPVYQAAYSDNNGGMGALIGQVFAPWSGGGKFLMVVLSLSVIANNVPNTYSAALSIQALGKPFQRIPRFLWTVLVAILYTVAGIAGRESFSAILSNLLSILSYWVAFFAVIVAEEHFIFRRNDGYNLDDYATPSKLPKGYAAIFAGCCGIAGAVVGMAQVYYTGPIAKLIGDEFGADLGFELAAGFAAITYPPLRYLEKKHFGR